MLHAVKTWGVREAEFKDIRALVDLCQRAHSEFGHPNAKFCPLTTRNTLQRAINQREGIVLVLTDGTLSVYGLLVGITTPLWYSRKKQASDLFFYVDPEARGHGGGLITRFLGWARKNPNVVEIVMGITSGEAEEKYQRSMAALGFSRVGGYYQLILGEKSHVESDKETG